MAAIRLVNVRKVYPGGHVALHGLDLEVTDGELLVLVGPSGCGKSTALRLVAGLESPTHGHVFLGERDVTEVPPQGRDLAMVFQNYALYPHLSVRENLAFGLRMRGVPKSATAERVAAVARTLGIDALLDRKPAQLSGGQRQRVALGRAIVREPQAFLLDEPLSNLDVRLRVETRAELARLHRRLGATMLYVTHDQEEAMTLGQRVAVMHEGRIPQIAPPLDIYRRPVNLFVAGFLGSPAMNLIHGSLREAEGHIEFASLIFVLALHHAPRLRTAGRDIVLGVRPHDLSLAAPEEAEVRGRVEVIEPRGSELVVHITPEGSQGAAGLTVVAPAEGEIAVGDHVGLHFRQDRLHFFAADSGERLD